VALAINLPVTERKEIEEEKDRLGAVVLYDAMN